MTVPPTKQQTLTIVVHEAMGDPADLVEAALERYIGGPPARDAEAFADLEHYVYMIIEED